MSPSSVTSFLLLLHLAAADCIASGLVRGVGAVRGDADHDGGGAEGRDGHAATGKKRATEGRQKGAPLTWHGNSAVSAES